MNNGNWLTAVGVVRLPFETMLPLFFFFQFFFIVVAVAVATGMRRLRATAAATAAAAGSHNLISWPPFYGPHRATCHKRNGCYHLSNMLFPRLPIFCNWTSPAWFFVFVDIRKLETFPRFFLPSPRPRPPPLPPPSTSVVELIENWTRWNQRQEPIDGCLNNRFSNYNDAATCAFTLKLPEREKNGNNKLLKDRGRHHFGGGVSIFFFFFFFFFYLFIFFC